MQLITATTPLLLLPGLVAAAATRTAARDGVGPVSAKALPLAGAVPARAAAAPPAARDVLVQEDAHAAGSGYTYRLSVNASLPLDPRFDRCIAWPAEEEGYDKQGVSNGVNFTWYGFRLQLPEDGHVRSGFRYSDITGAVKELGWTQDYGDAAQILEYNVTTTASRPTVKLTFNDELFWNTFTFDFVQTGDMGAAVSDGGDYQEFTKELRGAIYCWTYVGENSRKSISAVVPTLTISMRRLEGPDTVVPVVPAPSNAAAAIRGRRWGLGVLAAVVTWAWTAGV